MSSQDALQVYLEDHMAGSVAASDLARRGADNNQGPLATFYAGLLREIEADRRTLDQIATSASRAMVPMNFRVRIGMTEMCGWLRKRALRAGMPRL